MYICICGRMELNSAIQINFVTRLTCMHIYIYILPVMNYLLHIGCALPIECLLIALVAHMFSHPGYGPVKKAQGPKAAGPGPGCPQLLGLGPWSQTNIHYG